MRLALLILFISVLTAFSNTDQIYKDLGAAKYKVRKAALKKAKKLPIKDKIKLVDRLNNSKDPELHYASKQIIPPIKTPKTIKAYSRQISEEEIKM